jgi:hypothetical protein
VLRGEPGIGKTALLSYAGERAGSMRILRATGIESEGELAFGGLYSPVLSLADRLDAQPGRYAALRAALGLRGGTVAAGAARMLHSETGGNPGRNGGIRHADRRQR